MMTPLQQGRNFWKFYILFCFSPSGELVATPLKEKATPYQAKTSSLPDDLLYKGAPIDPFCFPLNNFLGEPDEPVSLSQCTQKAKIYRKKGLIKETDISRFNGFENTKTGEYLYYQYIGTLSSGEPLIYKLTGNYRGTGRFSTIDIVQRKGPQISLVSLDGGDRSFGGIGDVSFKNGILKYTKSLTPMGLFDFWQAFNKTSKLSDTDLSTLRDCAVCEVARVYWAVPESSLEKLEQENHLVKISLVSYSEAPPIPSEPQTFQECFDVVYNGLKAQGIESLSLKDLNSFFEQVIFLYRRQNSQKHGEK